MSATVKVRGIDGMLEMDLWTEDVIGLPFDVVVHLLLERTKRIEEFVRETQGSKAEFLDNIETEILPR